MAYSTAAQEFAVATYLFSDPAWTSANGPIDRRVLNSTISFSFMPNGAIQTLSASTAQPGSDVTGFLYTPDLSPDDPCRNASAPYVPSNVTRQGSLPNTDYVLIALAPWLNATCTINYLRAAQQDPVRGFLFFLPDNSTSVPPAPSDPVWDLGDGGAWKNSNRYPVFAIPGPTGKLFMKESALYSGNITSVPNGQQLAQAYNPTDYVRLFVDVGIENSTSLPSLWVFLLIVVGILIGIIITASALMHWLQLKRRRSLRRRIAAGEVDLEALGIQRLTVPQEVLDRMPLFEYGTGVPLADEDSAGKNVGHVHVVPHDAEKELSQQNVAGSQASFTNYKHQTTCAICLDDFTTATAGTVEQSSCAVRQLPCNHIFHPECVDTFLRENSSLCPLCKSSALPQGYCPRVISNVMVRRERMVRRMRARMDGGEVDQPRSGRTFGILPRWHRRSPSREALSNVLELQQSSNTTPQSPTNAPSTDPPIDTPRRREWARQRALAMAGRSTAPPPEHSQSRWKKVLGGVFPGIA